MWQLKWELEDLAFRYLQPADYKHIAAALKARRSERENYMDDLKTLLRGELQHAGIDATIEGRPKHIYSIWRKMQAKQLAFEQLMDIRAARVLVNSVAECYAALGVVHSLWQFIPGEFDDYIATPKDNRYRSIHTAVIGPGAQAVEIQIRTHEMHAEFRTRRGGALALQGGRPRAIIAYERKINQLRSLLAPTEGGDTSRDFLDRMRVDLFQDRIYVVSPKGEIVDVPVGGTPLDFAYQVHTDLGHRTRGAKVNGRMVPLDYRLKNSETVEIITGQVAASVARLAGAPIRLSGEPATSQQGSRLVPQAERDSEQDRGPRDVRPGDSASGGGQSPHPRIAGRIEITQHRRPA